MTLLSLTSFQDYKIESLSKKVEVIIFDSKRLRSSIVKYLFYLRKHKPKIILSMARDENLVLALIKPFLNYKPKIIFREASTKEYMSTEFPKRQVLNKLLNLHFPLLVRILISLFYMSCSKIIVSSEDVANDIHSYLIFKKPPIKVISPPVLPAGFDKNKFLDASDPWIKDNSLKVILAVGRLCKQKRFDILIKAFSLVNAKYSNTRLIICGKGRDQAKLQNLSKQLNISKLISFKGFINDVYPYFKGSDIFCLSSEYEGFGLVLVEAMAFGTKIVSTKCKGGPNTLRDNQFIDFAKVNNYKNLSEIIIRSLYFPSPAPYLIKESLKYTTEEISKSYLKEML